MLDTTLVAVSQIAAVMPTNDGHCVVILTAGVSVPIALSVEAVVAMIGTILERTGNGLPIRARPDPPQPPTPPPPL